MKSQHESTPKRNYGVKVHIFTEQYPMKSGMNATCYSAINKEDILHSERCVCGNPYDCRCKNIVPDYLPAADTMPNSLFKHPRPMLMFTMQRGGDIKTRFSFFCKLKKEAVEEIKRLNSYIPHAIMKWNCVEEEKYNSAALSDYQYFLMNETNSNFA